MPVTLTISKPPQELKEEIGIDRKETEERQKLIELKTGKRVECGGRLDSLPDAWCVVGPLPDDWRAEQPRTAPLSPQYESQCRKILHRYVAFIRQRWPGIQDLASTTSRHAAEFMDAERQRGITARTWNATLQLLRCVYLRFQPEADAYQHFLKKAKRWREETVFREPFTEAELEAILKAAEADPLTRPLIVTAVCTAMRKGDVCLLRWDSVNLVAGFLNVRTAKTGQRANIPLLPMLAELLAERRKLAVGEYVFPEAAEMYRKNPQGITWRVKKVLAEVFCMAAATDPGDGPALLPELSEEETRRKGNAYLNTLSQDTKKVRRMRAVFTAYMDGAPSRKVCSAHGITKGTLSHYLTGIEAGAGCRIVRGRVRGASVTSAVKADAGERLRTTRREGQRRASVRDFHSFRVTFVTLALTNGMPLELVQKVTGHRTVAVVLEHYFQPGQEDFRAALLRAMPDLLTKPTATAPEAGPTAKTKEERLREAIGAGETDPARLLAILDA